MVLKSDLNVWPVEVTTLGADVPTFVLAKPSNDSSHYITGWMGEAGSVKLIRQSYAELAAAATWTCTHHADFVLDLAAIDFIMSFWIKMTIAGVDVGATAYLFEKDAADDDYYYFDTSAAGLPIFSIGDATPNADTITGTSNIANGKWHHIAITGEAGVATGLKMYVDGTLEATSDTFENVDASGSAEDLVLTAPTGGIAIANFAIYKAADLSAQFATEVAALYNSGRGKKLEGTETNLVWAANIDDGEGTDTEDIKGTGVAAISAGTWTAGGPPLKSEILPLLLMDGNGSYGAAFPHPIKVGAGTPIIIEGAGAYQLTLFGFTDVG